MFKVQPVSREAIDGWPIERSGLPARVVNSARAVGLASVGALRAKDAHALVDMRSIGRVSVREVARFFKLCGQIERGELVFITIQQVFDLFLDGEELNVLTKRFGLFRPDARAARNYMTLQEIGNELSLTRERIRQVEQIVFANLSTRLAQLCLQPFYLYLKAFIDSRERVVEPEDLMDLAGQSWLAGYNPCSITLLLQLVQPEQFTEHHGLFSTYTPEQLNAVHQACLGCLRERGDPVGLADLPTGPGPGGGLLSRVALGKLMDHGPGVAATLDDRYFLFQVGTDRFLREQMLQMERPVHYRTLARQFNQRLKPHCRKGNGFILQVLNGSELFVKTERAFYDLAGV